MQEDEDGDEGDARAGKAAVRTRVQARAAKQRRALKVGS
jgi:hypothetical protein